MKDDLDQERWRRLREEARKAAATGPEQTELWTRAALDTPDVAFLANLEQRLEQLNDAWAVHEKPLLTRVPLIGPFFAWLGTRLVRFLLQNQVVFNAEAARLLQELYQAQRLLGREQIERSDDLFACLEERILALEARLKDLEDEVARRRGQDD
jgi:hypothetical protein